MDIRTEGFHGLGLGFSGPRLKAAAFLGLWAQGGSVIALAESVEHIYRPKPSLQEAQLRVGWILWGSLNETAR